MARQTEREQWAAKRSNGARKAEAARKRLVAQRAAADRASLRQHGTTADGAAFSIEPHEVLVQAYPTSSVHRARTGDYRAACGMRYVRPVEAYPLSLACAQALPAARFCGHCFPALAPAPVEQVPEPAATLTPYELAKLGERRIAARRAADLELRRDVLVKVAMHDDLVMALESLLGWFKREPVSGALRTGELLLAGCPNHLQVDIDRARAAIKALDVAVSFAAERGL
jgi:hypothetical protein